MGVSVLKDLLEKTDKVLPREGNWKVFYLGFSRIGWKQSALDFARNFSKQGFSGTRWQAAGIMLIAVAMNMPLLEPGWGLVLST